MTRTALGTGKAHFAADNAAMLRPLCEETGPYARETAGVARTYRGLSVRPGSKAHVTIRVGEKAGRRNQKAVRGVFHLTSFLGFTYISFSCIYQCFVCSHDVMRLHLFVPHACRRRGSRCLCAAPIGGGCTSRRSRCRQPLPTSPAFPWNCGGCTSAMSCRSTRGALCMPTPSWCLARGVLSDCRLSPTFNCTCLPSYQAQSCLLTTAHAPLTATSRPPLRLRLLRSRSRYSFSTQYPA